MRAHRGELASYLRKVTLFHSLDDYLLAKLAAITTKRNEPKGEVIFWEGDPGEAMYVILSGAVQVYTLSPDGREKIFAILGPGEFFGEMALLDRGARSATAQALESTELAVIDRNNFEQLLQSNAKIALALLRTLSERLRQSNTHLEDLVFKDVQCRLAKVILELAKEHGQPTSQGIRLRLKLTHQQLANYVGTSRESVTRTLISFQEEGYLRFDRRYLLLQDAEALRELAESE